MDNIFSLRVRAKATPYSKVDIQEIIANSDSFNKVFKKYKDIANKRIKALNDRHLISNAQIKLKQQGIEKFTSSRNEDWQSKRIKLAQILGFLSNPTSTVQGAKEKLRYEMKTKNISYDEALELERKTDDYHDAVYYLSRQEYYQIVNGYAGINEILEDYGFDDDVKKYNVELEKQSNEVHKAYLTLIDKLTSSVNTLNYKG